MDRRTFTTWTSTATALGWVGTDARAAQPGMAGADAGHDAKTYVLVHGAYHGAWCWKQVAAGLRARGHEVYVPTQTGLGERAHLISFRPTLETFIEDVAQLIRYEELENVILVGHSFAGSTVSGVADRLPKRLRHLVYLDALILRSGQAPFDGLPEEIVARYRRQAEETSGGLSVPPPEPAYFGISDPRQAAWVRQQLTPHPFETYLSPLPLRHPVGNGLPVTYISCANPPFGPLAKTRAFVSRMKHWHYQEIASAHDAMLLAPRELTEMLAAIA